MDYKTRYAIPFLALVLLVTPVMTDARAQAPGCMAGTDGQTAYEKSDILHAMAVMENHITLDADYHFDIDVDAASNDPNVSDLDIRIIQSYAACNDRIMDATGSVAQAGGTDGNVGERVRDVVSDFEAGEFRKLFTGGEEGTTATSDAMRAPHSYNGKAIPPHHDAWLSICGGNFHDFHRADRTPVTLNAGGSLGNIQQILRDGGYHTAEAHAGFRGAVTQPFDPAGAVPGTDYGDPCDSGAFRNHAGIDRNFSYTVQDEDTNPEAAHEYGRPHTGKPAAWWHDRY